MAKYENMFTSKLEEEDRVLDVEAELEIKEDEGITPVNVATARSVSKHWQAAADELVKDLLAAGIIEEVTHSTEWCAAGHFVG